MKRIECVASSEKMSCADCGSFPSAQDKYAPRIVIRKSKTCRKYTCLSCAKKRLLILETFAFEMKQAILQQEALENDSKIIDTVDCKELSSYDKRNDQAI